jgi:CheY-like chemotaxis protein
MGSTLNGLDIARKIREGEKGTNNRAMIIANTTDDQSMGKCFAAGCDYFLLKDGSLKSLGELLEKCLHNKALKAIRRKGSDRRKL